MLINSYLAFCFVFPLVTLSKLHVDVIRIKLFSPRHNLFIDRNIFELGTY